MPEEVFELMKEPAERSETVKELVKEILMIKEDSYTFDRKGMEDSERTKG